MSRAFVYSSDDRSYCVRHKEACMYADEHGACVLKVCRRYPDDPVVVPTDEDDDEDDEEE